MARLLSIQDFNLFDVIQTKDGRTLTIGLQDTKDHITSKSAYKVYTEGKLVSKSRWTTG
ncbi:hypothetical protein [Lysinibacillus sp. OL1]|uniref:hypothetical protein n=1 Tax=Lysinibacillus sp. OL1 TaxID=2517243 RepID=UPI00187D1C98|nr:hypothetical protein [Lysinibacillus sp. OL1]